MEDLLIVKDLYEPIDRKDIPIGVIESKWKTLNTKGSGNHKTIASYNM